MRIENRVTKAELAFNNKLVNLPAEVTEQRMITDELATRVTKLEQPSYTPPSLENIYKAIEAYIDNKMKKYEIENIKHSAEKSRDMLMKMAEVFKWSYWDWERPSRAWKEKISEQELKHSSTGEERKDYEFNITLSAIKCYLGDDKYSWAGLQCKKNILSNASSEAYSKVERDIISMMEKYPKLLEDEAFIQALEKYADEYIANSEKLELVEIKRMGSLI
jgi:hypothetical protein